MAKHRLVSRGRWIPLGIWGGIGCLLVLGCHGEKRAASVVVYNPWLGPATIAVAYRQDKMIRLTTQDLRLLAKGQGNVGDKIYEPLGWIHPDGFIESDTLEQLATDPIEVTAFFQVRNISYAHMYRLQLGEHPSVTLSQSLLPADSEFRSLLR